MARLKFNIKNEVELPELILGKRNYDELGSITNVDDFRYEFFLKEANTIKFIVYEKINEVPCKLWNEIRDRRLVFVTKFDEWYEIQVTENDTGFLKKNVTGTHLCEVELSQIKNEIVEINTEDDIAREDYEATVFYNPSNTKASALHRVLKAAPHYSIKHVDESLWNLQRSFSISDEWIYDTLNNTFAEEFNCLFIFDSKDRSISVYDLETNCNHCGYRGDYTDICPECGSTDLTKGYGIDTTIYVDSENFAENIQLNSRADEFKNYFRIEGGDEIITAAVAACNPSGTNYIFSFSNEDKEDMSEELFDKLVSYESLYDEKTPEYKKLMEELYEVIDQQFYLQSEMMPDITQAETTASNELTKLNSANLSPVAVTNLKTVSVYTATNAVLAMAKCVANSTVYKIDVVDESTSLNGTTWNGKFSVINNSDETDFAESENSISITITSEYETYVKQKIEKTIDRDDVYLVDIFSNATGLTDFKEELKKYCLNRLLSFESAYQSIIDVLINANCANENSNESLYNSLYKPYYEKLSAIQSEISIRESELAELETTYTTLIDRQDEIQRELNLKSYLGDDLYKELCSFLREDTYKNENYISDGLNSSEVFEKAQALLDVAWKDIKIASTSQWTLSADMHNLLAIPEFKPITSYFEGGNWMRIGIDDKVYRLRLIYYKINFNEIQSIEVEFSDTTITQNGSSDVQNLTQPVSSMATSFNTVARQAEQGAKTHTEFDTIKNDGLNVALYNISNSINQEFKIDEHGLLGRKYDDIIDSYEPEQIKMSNNLIVFTDDYWETAKEAIGKFTYYNPFTELYEEKFGVIADTLIGNLILSETVGIYNEYNSISLDKNGLIITADGDDAQNSSLFTVQVERVDSDGNSVLEKLLYLDEEGNLNINGSVNIYSSSSGTSSESSLDGKLNSIDKEIQDIQNTIDGIEGIEETYFYIRYSPNSDGNPMTEIPDDETTRYMGVCNTNETTAPKDPSEYTWSLIKGADGKNGTPGVDGKDGKTQYLHIKYSNDGKTFTGNIISTDFESWERGWEQGASHIDDAQKIYTPNMIPVSPYAKYNISTKFDDSNKNFQIGLLYYTSENQETTELTEVTGNGTVEIPSDIYYVKVYISSNDETMTFDKYKELFESGDILPSMYMELKSRGEELGSYIGTLVDFIETDSDTFSDYSWKKFTEDVEDELNDIRQTIMEQNTNFSQTCENIRLEASELYIEKNEYETFKESTESQFSVISDNISLNFSKTEEKIETVNGDLQSQLDTITSYFIFDVDGLTIGRKESNFSTVIDDESMSFLDGDEKVAYISNQQLYINQAIINTLFNIGNYNFVPRDDGTLSIVWKS